MTESLIFEKSRRGCKGYTLPASDVPTEDVAGLIPNKFLRTEKADLPEVQENEVVRHFVNLSTLNHHVDKGMYPLGSCTMKYNPKVNELTSSLPGLAGIHPLQPAESVQGALKLMYELQESLREICGMKAVSLQPAAGAHGELCGIFLIRKYHEKQGRARKKILVPDSAHGTNPASSAIAGYTTVSVKSNEHGLTDLDDLRSKLDEDVAALMLTNPNTLGVFESQILEISDLIHKNGSLLYMDGANMNALLGVARPGDMGFDVVHYNLHKSFSTPHGGGGPGSGPVGVSERLEPFLPVPVVEKKIQNGKETYVLNYDRPDSIGKMIGFYGNFGIMVRAYTYIRMLGAKGLRAVAENAIINANYILSRLRGTYLLPFDEPVMHEFCLSGDNQKAKGVKTLDIAKRILDFGFHAPTIYFPLIVHECLMIEPTETESKETLDQFADVMLQIAREVETNPDIVLNAPHNTPVKRLDDAYASRNINVKYSPKPETVEA
ncbi:MAG: aminomethyl-transferring glycine dehydrogenase subunit GcvPB [Chlorobiales bacterium]|nr:aminomethyl-transferring glycine dehydrogenase subunit GcvPB [Chlorobiales bacterium]